MQRVTGIGGIFFKSKEPQKIKNWYKKHLGIPMESYGWSFKWRDINNPEKQVYTVWSSLHENTNYFLPGEKQFMINYIVENLFELLEQLRSEGVSVMDETEESEFGKFGWIIDPEGNKIELWEPPKQM